MIKPQYIQEDNVVLVTWPAITANEQCLPHKIRIQPELLAVQFEGSWGNAAATLEGSISNVSYVPASDMRQNTISVSANAGFGVLEPYIYWKPSVTGNVQTNVTVSISYWSSR